MMVRVNMARQMLMDLERETVACDFTPTHSSFTVRLSQVVITRHSSCVKGVATLLFNKRTFYAPSCR